MARIVALLLASTVTPMVDVSVYNLNVRPALTAGIANNGDQIEVATILRDGRMTAADLRAVASLGAGATVQLQRYRASDNSTVNLTAATVAGGASYVNSNAIGPVDLKAGDVIQLLVGGANITAASVVEVDLRLQH